MNAQTMNALQLANQVRTNTKRFREEVATLDRHDGAMLLASYLEAEEMPQEVGVIPVERFLSAARRVGSTQVDRFLNAAGIRMRMTRGQYRMSRLRVRDLSKWERDGLAAALRTWAGA